jgi:hypothetical protein
VTKQFTKEQHKLLESLVIDADMLGLSDREAISYIEQKIGLPISQSTYSRCKRKAFSDNEIKLYYKNYAKIGILQFHKERLEEALMIHRQTLQMWYKEINKEEQKQDKKLILDFVTVLRTTSQYLGNLAISLPPMAEISNMLDEQEEKIKQLNEKIQKIYKKNIGFIIRKEIEYNNYNNQISIDDDSNNTNTYIENNHPIVLNHNLAEDFIKECVENADDDSKNNVKLITEIREQLKKHLEAYQQFKKAQKEAVFEDL